MPLSRIAVNIVTFLAFTIIQSCSMSNTYLSIMQPGSISIEQNIKTIALVNRTLPESKEADEIGAVLTSEGLLHYKDGPQYTLDGLNNRLTKLSRFRVKNTNAETPGSLSENLFPQQLDWAVVNRICKENNAEAVAAIETYHSDCIVTNWEREIEKTVDGKKVKSIEYYYKQMAEINLSFRLYDPSIKTVIDQHSYNFQMNWQSSGPTPEAAVDSMISKRDAISKASYAAGINYGKRISPTSISVGRAYYRKGRGIQFEEGVRKAQENDWEGAAVIWERCVKENSHRQAGKAAYNIALALEAMGDLVGAHGWAMKSYMDLGNKRALKYSKVLDQRISQDEKLKQQMREN